MRAYVQKPCFVRGQRQRGELVEVDYPTYLAHVALGNLLAVDSPGEAMADVLYKRLMGPFTREYEGRRVAAMSAFESNKANVMREHYARRRF